MCPDGARGVGVGVDKELVVLFIVELADPAFGQRALFVFHRAAGGGRDAIFVLGNRQMRGVLSLGLALRVGGGC